MMKKSKEILVSVILGFAVVSAALILHHIIDNPDMFVRPQPKANSAN